MKFSSVLKIVLALLLIVYFWNCSPKKQKTGIDETVDINGFEMSKFKSAFKNLLKDESKIKSLLHSFSYLDTIRTYYENNDYRPIWLNTLKDSAYKANIIQIINDVNKHGYQSKWYQSKQIHAYFENYNHFETVDDDEYAFLAELDLLSSVTCVSLLHDFAIGRTNPRSIYGHYYTLPYRDTSYRLLTVLDSVNFLTQFEKLKPKSKRYQNLIELYTKAEAKYQSIKPIKIDTSQGFLEKRNLVVAMQKFYLMDLLPKFDTSQQYISEVRQNFDQLVSKCRKKLGMEKGGLDEDFKDFLMKPASFYRNDILANLERCRWFEPKDSTVMLHVNLPAYILTLRDKDSSKTVKICIGKRKAKDYNEMMQSYLKSKNYKLKPDNNETPQIGSMIENIVINPTWTVPNSIIAKEMYGGMVRNPNYLTRRGYKVFTNSGKEVNPASINWSKYKPNGIPYKIRQNAGNGNSLGKLKFNFPNGHAVYMHDTPQKGKFQQSYRAVSHGCVRLEKPREVAEFILKQQKDTTMLDQFRLKLGLQPYDTALQVADSLLKPIKNTEFVKIKKQIPVYFDYQTIIFDKDNQALYYKDIYRRNQIIAEAVLKSGQ